MSVTSQFGFHEGPKSGSGCGIAVLVAFCLIGALAFAIGVWLLIRSVDPDSWGTIPP